MNFRVISYLAILQTEVSMGTTREIDVSKTRIQQVILIMAEVPNVLFGSLCLELYERTKHCCPEDDVKEIIDVLVQHGYVDVRFSQYFLTKKNPIHKTLPSGKVIAKRIQALMQG